MFMAIREVGSVKHESLIGINFVWGWLGCVEWM